MRIPQPHTGDIVDLIIEDHRLFEELLRDLRDITADRSAARTAIADLLIAHGEAEDGKVFPTLVRNRAIGAADVDQVRHGKHGHDDINEALIRLLEADVNDTPAFDRAVADLSAELDQHVCEEEQGILNHARMDTMPETRSRLGKAFLEVRNEWLDKSVARDLEAAREVLTKHR